MDVETVQPDFVQKLHAVLPGCAADRVLWLEDGQFSEMVTMKTDPDCDMSLVSERAIWMDWNGQRYYFCAQGCRNEFAEQPEKSIPA